MGFGGSCFKKDILALIYLAEYKGLTEVADYWNQVILMNEFRKKNFFLRIYRELNQNLKGKKICVFGTAFKKDTNDPRESPAVEICNYMLLEGATLHIHDPKTTLDHVHFFNNSVHRINQASRFMEGGIQKPPCRVWKPIKGRRRGQSHCYCDRMGRVQNIRLRPFLHSDGTAITHFWRKKLVGRGKDVQLQI